jgi:hypothetical protein
MDEQPPIRPFTIEEAVPLLRVLSKLAPIRVVNASRFFRTRWPYVCWVDAPAFHFGTELIPKLDRYPGKGMWILFSAPPRSCITVWPNSARGESPFVVPERERERFHQQVQSLTKRLTHTGVPVLWQRSPFVDPEEFRAEKVSEMPKLGAYLEEELGLRDKPSLGVEFSSESFELPLIEDRAGPGGGVTLVADPVTYSETGLSTSPFDRHIHFWITPEENRALYSEISTLGGRDHPWPLLSRVVQSKYGLALLPKDIPLLAAEIVGFGAKSRDRTVHDALEKLQSICRSACNYDLGLFIGGV